MKRSIAAMAIAAAAAITMSGCSYDAGPQIEAPVRADSSYMAVGAVSESEVARPLFELRVGAAGSVVELRIRPNVLGATEGLVAVGTGRGPGWPTQLRLNLPGMRAYPSTLCFEVSVGSSAPATVSFRENRGAAGNI